jgi:hypothetical protein
MDSPNSSPDQEKQGEQQPNELPIFNDKDHTLEPSDHVPPLVSETIRPASNALATIVDLPFATRRRNKIPWRPSRFNPP